MTDRLCLVSECAISAGGLSPINLISIRAHTNPHILTVRQDGMYHRLSNVNHIKSLFLSILSDIFIYKWCVRSQRHLLALDYYC